MWGMRACDVMLHHTGLRGQREGRYRALVIAGDWSNYTYGWDVERSESPVRGGGGSAIKRPGGSLN